MSDSIQTQGKTVNDAVSEALLQLGLRRDEVEIKVIEEPKSGLLGFIGSRPAKVMVRKKPARRRGRRDNHSGDDQAHSLSGGGRGGRSRGGRGGRGRSGRDNRQDARQDNPQDKRQDEQQDNRQEGRGGRGRGGRRGPENNQDRNEVRAEGREENRNNTRDGGRNEGRGGSRGRRGRPAERTDNQPGGGREVRQESRPESQQTSRQSERQEGRQASRRGGRGRGRGDDQVTVERSEEKTSRSRRGSRGGRGRGRGDQRDTARRSEAVVNGEPVVETPVSETPVNNAATPIDQSIIEQNPSAQVERERSTVSEKQTYASPRMDETPAAAPNNKENDDMTNDDQKPTPAAAATTPETPTPVAKPKAKRKGRGGGLGSRLPRKANPAVKQKPETVVIKEAAAPAPAARNRESRDDSHGRSDSRDRSDYRDRRPPAAPDEVIIDAVAATKYAKPVLDVTDETLDAALAELASGMLARAGFPCEVEVKDGEYRQVRISSDEESAGMLIGRHGQTVDAVEHLVERMACNAVDDRVRMNLDINGYRQRRSESLQERVADAVAEVRETGRAYHVEPMSARERRLVHLEVESVEGIRTYTMVGSGGKYVVIALDDEADDSQQNED